PQSMQKSAAPFSKIIYFYFTKSKSFDKLKRHLILLLYLLMTRSGARSWIIRSQDIFLNQVNDLLILRQIRVFIVHTRYRNFSIMFDLALINILFCFHTIQRN